MTGNRPSAAILGAHLNPKRAMSTYAHSISSPATASATRTLTAAPRRWQRPAPNAALMWLLGIVNRWLLVRGYLRIRRIELPAGDRERLQHAVNRGTAAFMGPNHPEFGADWLIDKELSTIVAPQMASWADRGIVTAAPRFWGANNLVANDGGDAAKHYSIECAVAGNGVLLHPEGSVRWTNDYVHPLFPGIAQMAMRAVHETDKPVYIVPLVWKYCFTADVSARLHREMRIIERALELPATETSDVAQRFAALHENILASRMTRFGYADEQPSAGFFERQRAFQAHLVRDLSARYATEPAATMDRTIARLKCAAVNHRDDAARAEEAKRLGEMSEEVYGAPTLTQEQMSECLKRTRDRLMRSGWRNVLANTLPCPLGARVVHVGVPQPIRVVAVKRHEQAEYEVALLELTRASMQAALDDINCRIASAVKAFAVRNLLASE